MSTLGSPTIAYRANTTATTLIRSQCRARPDGISSVSRADASRFIAPGITTPHACSSDDDPKTESPQEQADVQMTYPLIEGIWAKLTPKGTVTVVGTDSES